jgi:hypothetical protein
VPAVLSRHPHVETKCLPDPPHRRAPTLSSTLAASSLCSSLAIMSGVLPSCGSESAQQGQARRPAQGGDICHKPRSSPCGRPRGSDRARCSETLPACIPFSGRVWGRCVCVCLCARARARSWGSSHPLHRSTGSSAAPLPPWASSPPLPQPFAQDLFPRGCPGPLLPRRGRRRAGALGSA